MQSIVKRSRRGDFSLAGSHGRLPWRAEGSFPAYRKSSKCGRSSTGRAHAQTQVHRRGQRARLSRRDTEALSELAWREEGCKKATV